MGRVSRPETVENYEFSKSVNFFLTFSEAKNGLKMTFQAISRAENLFPAEWASLANISGHILFVRGREQSPKEVGKNHIFIYYFPAILKSSLYVVFSHPKTRYPVSWRFSDPHIWNF